tara:strand:- start:59012 stop:59248 length:237 start_codon:yes stop_codon:yes gene_type:complete
LALISSGNNLKREQFMRSQVHNEGELSELNVKIEKKVVEDYKRMAENSEYNLEELVVIALKRFRASHCDYLKEHPTTD